jgi:hypothetical protein
MPWVKLDDRFPSHRKIALLSDRAFRLHVSAICWCSENLTDGRIGERELPLVAHIRGLKATAQQLEDAGVWDRTEDGWVIHDFLDYNPSREQILIERKKNAARQEKFRQKRNGKPVPPDGSNARSNGVTKTPGTHDGDTNAARRRHDGDTTATGNRREERTDPHVNGVRNGVTNGAPSRPVPTPTPDMADVGGEGAGSETPDLDHLAPTPIEIDGFQLTDSMRRWALQTYGPTIDIDHSTAQFVSHYRSTGARRKSWPDAWQKWIRDDAKRASERGGREQQGAFLVALPGGGQAPPRPSTTDARVQAALDLGRQMQAEHDAAQEAQ